MKVSLKYQKMSGLKMTSRSDWNIIFGPPGTGKTTFGMSFVDQQLNQGINPSEIAYLAFTRKAAIEARTRAQEQFDFGPKDLPYFKTIHSFCFHQLNLNTNALMQKSNWLELGDILGLEVSGQSLNEEAYTLGMPLGDRLFFLDNLARIKQESLEQAISDTIDDDVSLTELTLVSKTLKSYKQKHNLLDFTDILEQYLVSGSVPKLKALFVDEAQDLSKLQWAVIHKVAKNVGEIYAAGDDDQAIYRWAGASVGDFARLRGKRRVLSKSYRVPDAVHSLALRVSSNIAGRVEKRFYPSGNPGYVRFCFTVDDLDLTHGDWLLLARNSYLLKQYERVCEQNGFPYESASRKPLQSKALTAIKEWIKLGQGETLFGSQVKNIRRFHGFKLKHIDDERLYTLDELPVSYGPWDEVFERLNPTLREYFLAAKRQGESLDKPRIKINTIHGVKGGEADHVAIMTDMAARSYKYMQQFPDDEHRVFYVALTRAKHGVNLIQPNSRMFYEI